MWLLIVGGALYLYFFEREFVQRQLQSAMSTSTVVGSIVYILLGSFRAFTLVPATFLLLIGLPFFAPFYLLVITMITVVVSSSIVYFFAEALHMDEYFETHHPKQIQKLKRLLTKYQLPIIIGWSFMMFLPTDLICYVCGTLRINFTKFIVGVIVGEGSVYAIYIYAADYFLRG
ncbi:MAG TPA: VTT domain-containing protein [Vicinamibacterales bacterium]|nr:VTT domain-containing protein [Vicinamibacterales bacterium]